MRLPEAEWQKRPGMRQLLPVIGADRGDSRFVGGCVRDALLGLPVSDIDIATRLRPEEVLDRLREAKIKAVPTGLAHGTVTAVLNGQPIEITSLRRDVSTDGRRATIAFTDDWREDAARRDFTINALSADPISREVFDYFHGEQDIEAHRVRFIGDPFQRIAEDHLRILRFFRFHARFGKGEPDAAGLEACARRANDLMALSRERIADELLKILSLPNPAATLQLMVDRGIWKPVLPEIDRSGIDRLRRLIEREQVAGSGADPVRRLAALLPPDAELAEAVGMRLRLSKKQTKRLVSAAARPAGDDQAPRALAYRIGVEEAVDRLLLGEDDPKTLRQKVAELTDWKRPRLGIGGGELIGMGLSPGPLVARTLQAIEQEWVDRGFPDADVQALARAKVAQVLRESQ